MNSEARASSLDDRMARDRLRVEERLRELVTALADSGTSMRECMEYSLLGGGKRLRPLLCLWTHDACGGTSRDACLDVACALECLHTYSLVHDDLPCMDDDDMRRGKPSSHKKFGEAMAVLTGDALLTLCFEILATLGDRHTLASSVVVEVTRLIARAAGSSGLIAGQVMDLSSGEMPRSVETVDRIHHRKTAVLIGAAMEAGAAVATADQRQRRVAREAGLAAGRAFQIVDDVLDRSVEASRLGKTPGKDERSGKLTYPALIGDEASFEKARALVDGARAAVGTRPEAEPLLGLLNRLVERSK